MIVAVSIVIVYTYTIKGNLLKYWPIGQLMSDDTRLLNIEVLLVEKQWAQAFQTTGMRIPMRRGCTSLKIRTQFA